MMADLMVMVKTVEIEHFHEQMSNNIANVSQLHSHKEMMYHFLDGARTFLLTCKFMTDELQASIDSANHH